MKFYVRAKHGLRSSGWKGPIDYIPDTTTGRQLRHYVADRPSSGNGTIAPTDKERFENPERQESNWHYDWQQHQFSPSRLIHFGGTATTSLDRGPVTAMAPEPEWFDQKNE